MIARLLAWCERDGYRKLQRAPCACGGETRTDPLTGQAWHTLPTCAAFGRENQGAVRRNTEGNDDGRATA